MKLNTLYFVCPHCYMEHQVRTKLDENAYFLTALGIVFHPFSFDFDKEINQFIRSHNINHITLVEDYRCTFISNVVEGKTPVTYAEKQLHKLYNNHKHHLDCMESNEEKKRELARLNMLRQGHDLFETSYIGNDMEDSNLKISGVLFDNKSEEFTRVAVPF